MDFKIQFMWDNEAQESGSFDALVERVRYAVPELLELNSKTAPLYNLTFLSERHEQVQVNG